MSTTKTANPCRIMLTNVRLAFPTLDVPEKFQGEGKPRYSATALIEPDSENHKAAVAAMRAAAALKWGEAKADAAVKGLTAGNKVALYDGNQKVEYDGFENMIALSAHAQEKSPPRLLDGLRKELPRDTGVIYGGCFVNMSVEFWAQDNKWGKRLNATLRGVQFCGDGDSFSAARPADADEFGVVEGAHSASDSDFDGPGDNAAANEFA